MLACSYTLISSRGPAATLGVKLPVSQHVQGVLGVSECGHVKKKNYTSCDSHKLKGVDEPRKRIVAWLWEIVSSQKIWTFILPGGRRNRKGKGIESLVVGKQMGSRSLSKEPILFLYHAIPPDNRARHRNTTVEENVRKEPDNLRKKNSTENFWKDERKPENRKKWRAKETLWQTERISLANPLDDNGRGSGRKETPLFGMRWLRVEETRNP